MANLDEDIAAYGLMQDELERSHFGRWVLVHDRQLVDIFPSFKDAAKTAARNFGRGPYLIRQVGVRPAPLPVSLIHRSAVAES